jgi:paraquat-inducible protein A
MTWCGSASPDEVPPLRDRETMAEFIICRDCDTVHLHLPLARGQVARCIRCGAVIARHTQANVNSALAIASACAILLLIANFTSVLGIEIAGTHTEVNVWQAVLSMQQGWTSLAALVLLVTMLLVPLVQVTLVLWLMGFARVRRRAPGFGRVLAILHHLRPWSMSEVFLLGALVAIVKLGSFIPIAPGPGVWALALLTVLLAVLGHFDPRSWWALERGAEP